MAVEVNGHQPVSALPETVARVRDIGDTDAVHVQVAIVLVRLKEPPHCLRQPVLREAGLQRGVTAVGLPIEEAILELAHPLTGAYRALIGGRIAQRALLPALAGPGTADAAVHLHRPGVRVPVDR